MSSAVDLKTKEEKDAELDKRIEALRKKNEALVKRHQEIQEDKKKAEQEGIAVTTPRRPRPHDPETDRRKMEKENITVTVDLCKPAGEKRVVNDWKAATPRGRKSSEENDDHKGPSDDLSTPRRMGSGRVGRGGPRGGGGRQERRDWEPRTPREGEPGEPRGPGRRGGRRGGGEGGEGGGGGGTPGGVDRKSKEWEEKRRQNIEKMNEEMERIAEYERGQRADGDKPIRNFLDDPRRSGPALDMNRKEGSRRHIRNWGGLDFDKVKTGAELEREWTSRRPGAKGSVDMTMSMTGRERAEYLRWKKEREQIDEERLARHRNATGQWRREWDAQKTENMFKEEPCVTAEGVASEPGSRRDDSKRPPKAPTFGDFLSQGRSQGPRGDRSRGRGRGQKQNYSMHDNRWEGDKEDEEKEKEDKRKKEMKTGRKSGEEENPKPPTPQKSHTQVEENNSDEGAEDDDEWEDASDEEYEEVVEERSSRGSEKKDKEKPTSSKRGSPTVSAGSPKEQRTPRPKVHIPPPPPPAALQESSGANPPSPFCPLEGHQPVSDWGEEMELLSPRSSTGGESPLKPPSTESSPPQKTDPEEENRTGSCSEPQKQHTADVCSPETRQQPLTEPKPELTTTHAAATLPSSPAPSEMPDPTPSSLPVADPVEVRDAADQHTNATPSPGESPAPSLLPPAEKSPSESEEGNDEAPAGNAAASEPTSSG